MIAGKVDAALGFRLAPDGANLNLVATSRQAVDAVAALFVRQHAKQHVVLLVFGLDKRSHVRIAIGPFNRTGNARRACTQRRSSGQSKKC